MRSKIKLNFIACLRNSECGIGALSGIAGGYSSGHNKTLQEVQGDLLDNDIATVAMVV